MVKELEEIAKVKKCTTAQLALAWVLQQRDYIIPIPGTKRLKYLEENAAAVDIKLTEDELKKINNAAPLGFTKGTRYTEQAMKALNR